MAVFDVEGEGRCVTCVCGGCRTLYVGCRCELIAFSHNTSVTTLSLRATQKASLDSTFSSHEARSTAHTFLV